MCSTSDEWQHDVSKLPSTRLNSSFVLSNQWESDFNPNTKITRWEIIQTTMQAN